jgi:hypothetical protein
MAGVTMTPEEFKKEWSRLLRSSPGLLGGSRRAVKSIQYL